MSIRFGCQTYTWQMSYEKYKNQLGAIMDTVQESGGFEGLEAEVCMLGDFYDNADSFGESLKKHHLKLAALTLALPWLHPEETAEEKQEADRLIHFLNRFPEAKLILVQLPGKDRSNLRIRQDNCLKCVNAVAQRASEQGIICAFHPNSPEGSVFRTAEDYQVMFSGLNTHYVGYCPDTGHIANGGMDPLEVIRGNRPLVKHCHFKDISADQVWTAMGRGVIAHPEVTSYLKSTGYDGWIMVEEESERAESEPDAVTIENGHYIRQYLKKS